MDKIIKQIYAGFDRFPADMIGIDSPGYIHIRDKCYEAHEVLNSPWNLWTNLIS